MKTVSSVFVLLSLSLVLLGTREVCGYALFCSPKLWEGRRWTLQIQHTDQGPDVWESTAEFSIDILGQRLASHETGVRNGKAYDVFYLYYYPASTLYKVQDGVCVTSQIHGNISEMCVNWDGNVVEYLKEYLGDYDDGVITNGVRSIKDGVGYFYSVDPNEGSVPIMEETQGIIDGVPTYTVTNYYNVTLGIRDAAIFTPPEVCLKRQIRDVDVVPERQRIIFSL